MKLFFASDIHGSFVAAQKAIAAFEQSGARYLILLGDILNHGPRNPLPEGYDPIKVAKLLNQYAARITAVRGNCDSEVDQMLLDFPMMADYNLVMLANGRRLFLTHGHIYNADKHPQLMTGDVIVSGHTHIPVAERKADYFVFNPGSVAIPRNGLPASYGLLDGQNLSVVSFEHEVLAQTILN
ncbi:phosphodiesterase [Photobacterium phosphoreum]|uniref:phosphodiesterase n=1 Tax=Photobacterium phosphoreum TaxID=659 RepID=UPI0007F8DCD9|nr:phosphodiesterase [Photobacterium phosphoreum]OBU36137.1 YfcE family phosphodiesterase [Photobacterium phosphoreum]OBU40319.1 YfcE family phosphodiesterase [Photobacterium phosphoreum]PSU68591.1 phosphodiesterase [Photobacterium phosphoreum]PSU75628.1 phosphodiesterase [Photobacterium phosphoreum]PSU81711.1 phosphodiesterase [Photobacterium phosphoreum]